LKTGPESGRNAVIVPHPAPDSSGLNCPVMNREPDFLHNLRQEMASAHHWWDRFVVIGFAVLAGLAVVGFTVLSDAAFGLFTRLRAAAWWAPLLWTPLVTAAVVWATRRLCPQAAGSGVPQVMAALAPELPGSGRSRFVSLRHSLAKVLGVSGGLLAGLSIGRQGPSVQVAAGVMHHARRYLSARTAISERELLVAGGAAGIAAAFNTPLGGIVFAIEELSRRLEQRSSGLMLAAIVVSGLVAVSSFGNLSYFGRIHADQVPVWALLGPGLLVALASGLLGGLLARLIIASTTGLPDRFSGWRARHPVRFAAGCGLAVAVIGILSPADVLGSGHQHTRELLQSGAAEHWPGLFTVLKFVTSWLSAWAGVPGGVFAPSLSMGASLGVDVAWLTHSPHVQALIALGMAAFLAAVTQTPITAMIIVMEMTDGHGMVLSLMAVALLASLVSRMVSRPLYSTLCHLLVQAHLPRADEAPPGPGKA
jgi:H+/Cl- antiporter ClcA